MRTILALGCYAALLTVAHCRVTFTHSEVLQEVDLYQTNFAKFKCDNGCLIYSDSRSKEMRINDGKTDISDFSVLGPADLADPDPIELPKSNDYKLVYYGAGAIPPFVVYVVDKNSADRNTIVYTIFNENLGYLAENSKVKRFTVLSSTAHPKTDITFNGKFGTGYPRIFATGYDAINEEECRPVYQARSQANALNSRLTIPSPILTVDMGSSDGNVALRRRKRDASKTGLPNSSLVYMSPGYTGCSYVKQGPNPVNIMVEKFVADVKSFDLEAFYSIGAAKEGAVQIIVNEQELDLYGKPAVLPVKKHVEADTFNVIVAWSRENVADNFALQFDLGETKTSTTETSNDMSTTSVSTRGMLTLSAMLTFAYVALR